MRVVERNKIKSMYDLPHTGRRNVLTTELRETCGELGPPEHRTSRKTSEFPMAEEPINFPSESRRFESGICAILFFDKKIAKVYAMLRCIREFEFGANPFEQPGSSGCLILSKLEISAFLPDS